MPIFAVPNGSLAQLVQSICLTSRGSGVRIPQLPLIIERQRRIKIRRFFCASCCMKTSFPHHSPKIRFTPFRCRPNRASVILCERGCRAIICLFSKVALRRLRRSNPSVPKGRNEWRGTQWSKAKLIPPAVKDSDIKVIRDFKDYRRPSIGKHKSTGLYLFARLCLPLKLIIFL